MIRWRRWDGLLADRFLEGDCSELLCCAMLVLLFIDWDG